MPRHNAGNRKILVQLLFYIEKNGQILSEELLLFQRLFYKDEDQKQKNLIKTQAVQVLQTLFLKPISNLFILLLENQFH